MPEETEVIEKKEVEEKKDSRDEILDKVTEIFMKGMDTGDMKQAITLAIEYLMSTGIQISPEELIEEIKIRLAEKGIKIPEEAAGEGAVPPPAPAGVPPAGAIAPPRGA